MLCKKKRKDFWQYINRKTTSKSGVGDLKWSDSNGNEHLVEPDHDKSEALQEFFSSVYTVESEEEFVNLPQTVASPGFCVGGHRFGIVKRPKIINVCRTTPGSTTPEYALLGLCVIHIQ